MIKIKINEKTISGNVNLKREIPDVKITVNSLLAYNVLSVKETPNKTAKGAENHKAFGK